MRQESSVGFTLYQLLDCMYIYIEMSFLVKRFVDIFGLCIRTPYIYDRNQVYIATISSFLDVYSIKFFDFSVCIYIWIFCHKQMYIWDRNQVYIYMQHRETSIYQLLEYICIYNYALWSSVRFVYIFGYYFRRQCIYDRNIHSFNHKHAYIHIYISAVGIYSSLEKWKRRCLVCIYIRIFFVNSMYIWDRNMHVYFASRSQVYIYISCWSAYIYLYGLHSVCMYILLSFFSIACIYMTGFKFMYIYKSFKSFECMYIWDRVRFDQVYV